MLFPCPNPNQTGGEAGADPHRHSPPKTLIPSLGSVRTPLLGVPGAGAALPLHQLTQDAPRMSFDLNEPPATAEEAGVPQQAALVVSKPHKPLSVATTYPPNLFQAAEGLHGRLNNNTFMHASSSSGFQPFERNKDSLNTEVPILAEVLGHGATGPESIKDLECKEAEETGLVVMPQESAIAMPQIQQHLHHVQPGEASQLQGMLNNNVFDASEVERMKEGLRKNDGSIAALQHNFGVMEQNYADVNRRIGVLEHLSNANESLRKKEEELSNLQHNFEVMEQNYADANKRIRVLEEHLRDANESLRNKEEELSNLQHSFEVMEQNYADANTRIRVLEEHLRDANESLRKKEAELTTLQHSFEVIERNYGTNKRIGEEQLTAANESLRKKEEELTALKHGFGVTDQNYAGARKRIRVLEDQLSTVNESLQKKEEELTALKHNFGAIKQNYAGATKIIRVLDNLRSASNDSLKREVQKAQSMVENLKKVAYDAILAMREKSEKHNKVPEEVLEASGELKEATGDSTVKLVELLMTRFEQNFKITTFIVCGKLAYKTVVQGLAFALKKATEEHKKASEDDPMMVEGPVHELHKKVDALLLEFAIAKLCASIFSLLEDLAKDCIPRYCDQAKEATEMWLELLRQQ